MVNMQRITECGAIREFKRGEVICSQGDRKDSMYVVLKGSVCIFTARATEHISKVATLREGSFFGERNLFIELLSPFTAIAEKDGTGLLVINRSKASSMVESQPELAYAVMQSLAEQASLSGDNIPATMLVHTMQSEERRQTAVQPMQSGGIDKVMPQGHKHYALYISDSHKEFLVNVQVVCPVCKKKTSVRNPRLSKLKTLKTENDFRIRYENFEKSFYNIYTCADCYYSHFFNEFANPLQPRARVALTQLLGELQSSPPIPFVDDLDINVILKKYYLAIYCAKAGKPDNLLLARYYMNLSWLYGDMEDEEMKRHSLDNAYTNYESALYSSDTLTSEQEQSICLMLGELNFQKGNIAEAKKNFFAALKCGSANILLTKMAQDRVQDLRNMIVEEAIGS